MKDKRTKQSEAREREFTSNSRTVKEQLDELDFRLGMGLGARKERAKLLKETAR